MRLKFGSMREHDLRARALQSNCSPSQQCEIFTDQKNPLRTWGTHTNTRAETIRNLVQFIRAETLGRKIAVARSNLHNP